MTTRLTRRLLARRIGVGCAISALLVVAVSAPAGATAEEVNNSQLAEKSVDAEVFMAVSAKRDEVAAVREAIQTSADVKRFAFLNHRATYGEASQIFANQPDIMRDLSPADFPESFKVDFAPRAHIRQWIDSIKRLPNVRDVIRPGRTANKFSLDEVIRLCDDENYVVEAFMAVHASDDEIANVRRALEADPDITIVRFLSHEDALDQFRKEFANDKEMLSKITADQLPTSFRFRVANGAEARVLAEVQILPGVTDVGDPHAELCGPLLDSLNGGTRS